MSDSFEFTLHNPLSKEDWDKLTDVELEKTEHIWFETPSGKKVDYISTNVFNKIRAELHANAEYHDDGDCYLRDEWIDEIFDKYKAESDHKCHNCKHYTSGERDGSCDSYICKHYSGWESED